MTKDDLKQILSQPFEAEDWNRVLRKIFGVKQIPQRPTDMTNQLADADREIASAACQVSATTTSDGKHIGFYRVDLTDRPRIWQNRVGLRRLLRRVYRDVVDAALVVFVQGDKWRLSLISEIRVLDADGNLTEQKTEPKRFTYLLGMGETVRTPVERLTLYAESGQNLNDLIDAFAVEPLNRAFFREYRENVFDLIVAELRPQFPTDEDARLFTQRMLNRLMFLYFIQKKGWMRYGGSENYLRSLFDDSLRKGENFYKDRLYYVFFYGLSNQAESKEIHNDAKLEELRGELPYLNGGLFEMEPDGTDEKGKIKISNDRFADILKLFESYNFTIDESTPFEVQVAVDPEMLGKVFEELVTGRHSSGSYYTPRTVVSFMCREALKHALAECDTPEAIAKLVDESDGKDVRNPERILERLRGLRACDPACGSGAYLLGMLQELLHVREALFAATAIAKDAQYNWKREIIENNIYGVDIDRFATQIAALRLWLSLAIESDEPHPLPNLKYKIGCGDSLLAPMEAVGRTPDMYRTELIRQFKEQKRIYTDADDHLKKAAAEREIERIRGEIREMLDHTESASIFDWSVEFAEVFEDGGFDIVLANPPYVRQEEIDKDVKKKLLELYSEAMTGKSDLFVAFYARGLQLLREGGTHVFVCSNSWLDVGYGGKLQGYLLNNSHVAAIYDSAIERQFASADINTIISFIHKQKPSDDDITEFVSLRAPFLEALADETKRRVVTRTAAEIRQSGSNEHNRYEGDKWGGKYLRAPDIYFTILEKGKGKLVRLGDIAEVRFGIKTGANDFFYLSEEDQQRWQIEEEFLKPVIKSPRECRSIVVKPEDLKFKLFYCHKDKHELRGTNALRYIEWGETDDEWIDERTGRPNPPYARPSCRGRRKWYDVGKRRIPEGVIPCSYRESFFVYRNTGVYVDKRLYELETESRQVLPFLNSIFYPFFLEMQTRSYGGGGGPIDATVEEIQSLLVLTDNALSVDEQRRFMEQLEMNALRRIGTVFAEIEQPDRRALDNVIFDVLGLTQGERDAVYEAVIDLVSKRLQRAQTITG